MRFTCRSGLLTAIVGRIEDRGQETAPTDKWQVPGNRGQETAPTDKWQVPGNRGQETAPTVKWQVPGNRDQEIAPAGAMNAGDQ